MPLLLVMIGGAIGAGLRYQIGKMLLAMLGPGFPWWTWGINLSGGLFMGLLVGLLGAGSSSGESMRLLVGVGILGGYTTFSSFSLEAVLMIERGAWGVAAFYVTSSAVGSILALFAGLALGRVMTA